MKNSLIIFSAVILLFSCQKTLIRKPISHNTGVSFFEESIQLQKELIAKEELAFKKIITKDTVHQYKASPFGFWYYYNKKTPNNSKKPISGSEVIINYEIRALNNTLLLSAQELGSKNQIEEEKNVEDRFLKVDGEDFLLGLHEGIKLMKQGEIITFLMPSNKAFGTVGFGDIIAPNQPLIIQVELKQIIK